MGFSTARKCSRWSRHPAAGECAAGRAISCSLAVEAEKMGGWRGGEGPKLSPSCATIHAAFVFVPAPKPGGGGGGGMHS